jgi:MFS transporter, Spinster family, sphingosine-1-phosphate transporter
MAVTPNSIRTAGSRDAAAAGPPESSTAWAALGVLTLINMFNYVDRFVVPAVGESIRHSELHTTDSQFGLLTSAFLFVYMCTAPIFGAYGDRPWRLRLIAAGIAVWSIATALAGLAHSYPTLVAARASVGIGEAAYSAIAPAVLADLFPERLRGRVFAIFYAAIPVGSALGYVLGGYVDHHYGWRAAFFVAGLPGLLLAALMLTLRNPAPGAHDAPPTATDGGRGAGAGTRGFRAYGSLLHNRPYLRTVLGYAAYTFALGGISVWMPSFLTRVRHIPLATADAQLGKVLVVTGFVGTFVGGWVGDALMKRTRQGYLWLSGVTMVLAAPLGYIALTTGDTTAYWVALVLAELLLFASTGPINSAIVGDVPPAARAAAMAGSILVIHVLGDVPAPWLIGIISDRSSLERAVLIIPVAILASGAIWVYAAWKGGRQPSVVSRQERQQR